MEFSVLSIDVRHRRFKSWILSALIQCDWHSFIANRTRYLTSLINYYVSKDFPCQSSNPCHFNQTTTVHIAQAIPSFIGFNVNTFFICILPLFAVANVEHCR